MAVIYNPETEKFIRDPATIIDSSAGGDTVKQGFEDRTEPALEGIVSAFNLLKTDGMIGVGVPATETARGISRVATKAEVASGVTGVNGPAFVNPEQLSNIFRIRPGMTVPMAGTKLYPNCMWPDRSLVLFSDWPDLKAEYDAGYIMFTVQANAATYPAYWVLNDAKQGLYLPDIGGLFPRAWRAGTMKYDVGRAAGSYQEDATQQITGSFRGGTASWLVPLNSASGSMYTTYGSVTYMNNPGSVVGNAEYAINFDSARQVRTAVETRPQNYAQPISIYLGRHASEV